MEGQELKEFTYQGAPEVSDATVESHAEQQPKKQKFGEGLLSTVGKIGKGVDNFVKKVGNEGVSVGKSLIGKITKIKINHQCIRNKSSEDFDNHISIQLENNEEQKLNTDKLQEIEEKLESLKLPGATNEEELKEITHKPKLKSKLDMSKIKIGDIIEILDLHHCIARIVKPISNNFFLGMINHSVKCVIVLEAGLLIKCEINSDSPKIARIEETIELERLFKFDMKKDKKEVECRLHFINEDMDPFKPPEMQIYYIDSNCFEGFREMIKYHLKMINNTKVIYEVLE